MTSSSFPPQNSWQPGRFVLSQVFQGLNRHIDHYENRPVGKGGQEVPVGILKADSWEPRKRLKAGTEIRFHTDQHSAFFRPENPSPEAPYYGIPQNVYHLHDAGTYRLNRGLGLDVVPQTELVELPASAIAEAPSAEETGKQVDSPSAEPKHNPAKKTGLLGSLQEWIQGTPLDSFLFAHPVSWSGINRRVNRLYEQFIFTVIAYDPDRNNGNLISEDNYDDVWNIDVNMAGADPKDCQLKMPPEMLAKIQGTKLPEQYQQKLRDFIAQEDDITQELTPYFGEKITRQFFDRARFLLAHPQVEDLETVRQNLLRETHSADSAPSSN